jgi:hypothetical protein
VNPPAAVQRPSAGPASLPRRQPRTPFLLGALAIAGALLVSQLLASPHFVPRITVDNRTGYEVLVEASGTAGDGWSPVATIDRTGSTSVEQVYDVGDVWRFRLTAQGVPLGTIRLTRQQLERAGWHLELPTRLGDALRAKNIDPQP